MPPIMQPHPATMPLPRLGLENYVLSVPLDGANQDVTTNDETLSVATEWTRCPSSSSSREELSETQFSRGDEQTATIRVKGYRHKLVPKSMDLKEAFKNAPPTSPLTTLMIRNIPNRFSQADLISELEELGFGGSFDFLYAPTEKGAKRSTRRGTMNSNVGYAFVNFLDAPWADRCMDRLSGHTFRNSQRVASVSVAHVQGLAANMAHYEKAVVNKQTDRRPIVFANLFAVVDAEQVGPR